MSNARMPVRRLTSEDAEAWSKVAEQQIFVADLVDLAGAPDAAMTVGFARLAAGEQLEISFPYDEVLVLTKGVYTVHPEGGEAITARTGEAIYLPAGSRSMSRAEEETEMVYVASPPAVYAEHVESAA